MRTPTTRRPSPRKTRPNPPALRVIAVHAPLLRPLRFGGFVIYDTSAAPGEPRLILLYPQRGTAAMHAIVMPLWDRPPPPEAVDRVRGLRALRSAASVAGLLRDARSADPVRRALAQRSVFEAYGVGEGGGEWRPNGMAVAADPRPTSLLDLDEMLGGPLAEFEARARAARR